MLPFILLRCAYLLLRRRGARALETPVVVTPVMGAVVSCADAACGGDEFQTSCDRDDPWPLEECSDDDGDDVAAYPLEEDPRGAARDDDADDAWACGACARRRRWSSLRP